jgi:tetratricopeptide (TPR) repeat protein
MHEAVAILREASLSEDPAEVFSVTQRAIASAFKVIMRADDSSGIIGDACRDLLDLNPTAAARARVPATKLVDWMLKVQFDDECDYFTIDPVAYADALGTEGMTIYRKKLAKREAALGPKPAADRLWSSPNPGAWVRIDWNAKRLAVYDQDVGAIVRTHSRDRGSAATLHGTAVALMEIGEVDAAIEWAKEATYFDTGHYAQRAAAYWCDLLAEHRPDELLDARIEVFRRWPSSSTAGQLYRDARDRWPDFEHEVDERLAARPRDAVLFTQLTLKDIPVAWRLAHGLGLEDSDVWDKLAKAYEKIDALAVLPVYADLVERDITGGEARFYSSAARRLKKMRTLASGSPEAADVDGLIADLRDRYRRRPRLQLEFDRAGLP